MKSQSERFVRKTLRKLARQRVAATLPDPTGRLVWVVERALEADDEDTIAALRTCHMRGWIEPLSDEAIPHGSLHPEGRLQPGVFQGAAPVYRLTSAGWDVVRGTHALVVATLVAASAGVLVGLLTLFLLYW